MWNFFNHDLQEWNKPLVVPWSRWNSISLRDVFQERKDREVHLDGVPVYCSSLFIDSGTLVLRFCIFLRAGKFFYKKNASRDSDGDASKSSLCIGLQCGNNNWQFQSPDRYLAFVWILNVSHAYSTREKALFWLRTKEMRGPVSSNTDNFASTAFRMQLLTSKETARIA